MSTDSKRFRGKRKAEVFLIFDRARIGTSAEFLHSPQFSRVQTDRNPSRMLCMTKESKTGCTQEQQWARVLMACAPTWAHITVFNVAILWFCRRVRVTKQNCIVCHCLFARGIVVYCLCLLSPLVNQFTATGRILWFDEGGVGEQTNSPGSFPIQSFPWRPRLVWYRQLSLHRLSF